MWRSHRPGDSPESVRGWLKDGTTRLPRREHARREHRAENRDGTDALDNDDAVSVTAVTDVSPALR
jgi:hypothetical protein